MAFRYPHRLHDAGFTLEGVDPINIKVVLDVMEKVGSTLDGAAAGIEERREDDAE